MNFLKTRLAAKNNKSNRPSNNSLALEPLEDRMMLSTVSIFAAGDTGQEAFELKVNDEVVATFENVGGDAASRDFRQFNFKSDRILTADDIRVEFINDVFDPANGLDRNLTVDRIVVDGVAFETESPSVFSTGLFSNGEFTGPGLLETEQLNVNGSFFFSTDSPSDAGSRIRVDAKGAEGGEIIALEVDGQEVERFTLSNTDETFLFEVDQDVSISDVQVRFVNDLFDPERGIDRNAIINNVQVIDLDNGFREVVRLTENPTVFSTGTFTQADGIVSGFARGNTLHTDGVFSFNDPDNSSSDNPGFDTTPHPSFAATSVETVERESDADTETEALGFIRVDPDEFVSGV